MEAQQDHFRKCFNTYSALAGLIVYLCFFYLAGVKMRKFAYCKVVLATSLVWVMLDMFILLYFSECNKCDDKKERGLPGREGAYVRTLASNGTVRWVKSRVNMCVSRT